MRATKGQIKRDREKERNNEWVKEWGKLGFIPGEERKASRALLLRAWVWGAPGSTFCARSGCRQVAHSSGCSSGPGRRSNPHCKAEPRKTRKSGHALGASYLACSCRYACRWDIHACRYRKAIFALIVSHEYLQRTRIFFFYFG